MGLKVRFTKKEVGAIPIPAKGRTVVYDTECPHLCVRVSPTGHRAYYFYAKVRGRPTKVKLGSTDVLPPERAREMASKMALAKATGTDPADERRARKAEPTLGELFVAWLERHAKPNLRTWGESERVYKAVWSRWANRKLSEVKKTHVATAHAETGQRSGPYAANRALSLLQCLYAKAEPLVGWSGPSPAKGVQRFKEHKRERFLTPAESQALSAAIDAEDVFWRAYWICAMWTGQRESSLVRMRWQDLLLDQALWIIPAEFSKNGRMIPVALLPPVVQAIRDLAAIGNGSPWVFSSPSRTGHITEVKGAWRRLKAAAGFTDPAVIPYTLRHNLASQLGIAGASQAIIHLDTSPVRAALAGVSAKLSESPKGGDNDS